MDELAGTRWLLMCTEYSVCWLNLKVAMRGIADLGQAVHHRRVAQVEAPPRGLWADVAISGRRRRSSKLACMASQIS